VPNCPTCHLPLTRQPNGLLKCGTCGLTYKPGQSTPLLTKYAPTSTVSFVSQDEKDIETFIRRVIQKLVPIYVAYPAKTKAALVKTRSKLRKGLQQVVDGRMTFQKWFDNIHRDLAKHPIDLAKILLDSTEDLNTPEAKELRKGCEQYLQFLTNMYNPQMTAGAGRG
jgi:hypothetical protein